MRSRLFSIFCLGLLWAAPVHAQGLLVPTTQDAAPLALVSHQVEVQIDEQVATTKVTQVFRNASDRALEATYIFPVPRGASVNKFSMWVNGKEEKGELVEADKARQIYTDIVRRAQDPGLLEYVGNDLLKVRVFPVPARGDQKLSLSFTATTSFESGLNEYVYPLRTNEASAHALEKFTLDAVVKSKHVVSNVYSPTHPIAAQPHGDHEVRVSFERGQAALDRDFVLYYSLGGQDVGLTALTYRPDSDADGYVMLLISPRAKLDPSAQLPRDFVFVLDTSGSMAGVKMEQARKALKFCLSNLGPRDRFALMNFATTVTPYADHLKDATSDEVAKAKKWADALEATGGTAIDAAMQAALEYRDGLAASKQQGRSFTVVFFTDGMPTVGETNPETILKHVLEKNTDSTRIFTFGVGHDVNAVLLDRLAEQTRAVSTYVRPEEDIEVKVSGLYAKISHPVLTEVELTAGEGVKLSERYPQKLPDLFHGGQSVVLAKYSGKGHALISLKGKVAGKDGGFESKTFEYEVAFPEKTGNDKAFVEGLWARRKVGYLLDQIRSNGEQKELVEEVVKLAKKHGITTPYTSYLVVPDGAPTPVVSTRLSARGLGSPRAPMSPPLPSAQPANVLRVFERSGSAPAPAAGGMQPPSTTIMSNTTTWNGAAPVQDYLYIPQSTVSSTPANVTFGPQLAPPTAQTGKEGVDLAMQLKDLHEQCQVNAAPTRQAGGRSFSQVNGVWLDQSADSKATMVTVKALSTAYFRMLERHPELKEIFQLGSRLVWTTPSQTVLVVDASNGKETMSDEEIETLFARKK
jgi:Ca-activated chloride channel family protein